jgi:hypothetical protein
MDKDLYGVMIIIEVILLLKVLLICYDLKELNFPPDICLSIMTL